LYAWATYKRGDIPDAGEIDYINNRVLAKFPTAELLKMTRYPVPKCNGNPYTEVRWEFEWIVFNYKNESEVKDEKTT
jgi:hypothetical protein